MELETAYLTGGMIASGALTNALVQLKAARDAARPFDYLDFIIALVIAGFSGVMFTLGATYISDDILVRQGVGGAGAFLGITGLNKITDTLLSVLAHRAGGVVKPPDKES